MAHHGGSLYVLQGGRPGGFWRYQIGKATWEAVGILPAVPVASGQSATGLVAMAKSLVAFSDRTAMMFSPKTSRWRLLDVVPFALSLDGGMAAADTQSNHVYVIAGGVSTRLGRLDVVSGRFEELEPRLPDVVSAEGNRLAVCEVDGRRRLYIHRGHDSSEIWHIDLADLRPRK